MVLIMSIMMTMLEMYSDDDDDNGVDAHNMMTILYLK